VHASFSDDAKTALVFEAPVGEALTTTVLAQLQAERNEHVYELSLVGSNVGQVFGQLCSSMYSLVTHTYKERERERESVCVCVCVCGLFRK
jgi:hypothetical protein